MNIESQKLERYAFLWTEGRLVVAAATLILSGTTPIAWKILPASFTYNLINIAWLLTLIATLYLIYSWYNSNRTIFGGTAQKDMLAFWIAMVSGVNLGLVGIGLNNIGLSIISFRPVLILVGIIYLAVAYHLYTKWKANDEKLFTKPTVVTNKENSHTETESADRE